MTSIYQKKKRNVTSTTNAMNFYDIVIIREQDSQKNTENRFICYVSAHPDPELKLGKT